MTHFLPYYGRTISITFRKMFFQKKKISTNQQFVLIVQIVDICTISQGEKFSQHLRFPSKEWSVVKSDGTTLTNLGEVIVLVVTMALGELYCSFMQ